MKTCPSCYGSYRDDTEKCPVCGIPLLNHNEIAEPSRERIEPESLESIGFCASLYKGAFIIILIFGVIGSFAALFTSPLYGIVSLVCTLLVAFSGFMISALFRALHDIVRALYHIANK